MGCLCGCGGDAQHCYLSSKPPTPNRRYETQVAPKFLERLQERLLVVQKTEEPPRRWVRDIFWPAIIRQAEPNSPSRQDRTDLSPATPIDPETGRPYIPKDLSLLCLPEDEVNPLSPTPPSLLSDKTSVRDSPPTSIEHSGEPKPEFATPLPVPLGHSEEDVIMYDMSLASSRRPSTEGYVPSLLDPGKTLSSMKRSAQATSKHRITKASRKGGSETHNTRLRSEEGHRWQTRSKCRGRSRTILYELDDSGKVALSFTGP